MDEHNNAKALMNVNCGIKQYIKFSFRMIVVCFYILGCLIFIVVLFCVVCYFRGCLLFVIRLFYFILFFCSPIKETMETFILYCFF